MEHSLHQSLSTPGEDSDDLTGRDQSPFLREYLEKAEYIKSYKRAAGDIDTLLIAEEGMEEYLRQIEE